ncbi:uncharacterized protein BX663DRAFT_550910 [Cokeromyces recurvatus]|uniref:uncharacterized protein n=1 Tax=Cokeromyces recurvatus TaxID=90255 RepID=UPI00221F2863|nr:uncharacterized protein BX663DRAFT_550910 [Cokeromyces recurvatus]KAI7903834.1 hypothetical protein BX663DRAFT_550910 [Cokeromyces recurvatus]
MVISTRVNKVRRILFPPSRLPNRKIAPTFDNFNQYNILDRQNMIKNSRNDKRKEIMLSLQEKSWGVEHPSFLQNPQKYKEEPLSLKDFSNANSSSACIRQIPIYDHPNKHDKRVISSAIKRWLLPHKSIYELEWSIPNPSLPKDNNKVWLQLDREISNNIEYVRRLGLENINVRLDDNLTDYIKSTTFGDLAEMENISIQVFFNNQIRKEEDEKRRYSLFSNKQQSSQHKRIQDKDICLLRIRRVHWWTKSYNIALTHLPCTD